MRFSLTKSLVVLAVLSGVDARPWPGFPWAKYLIGDEAASAGGAGGVQARGAKEVKIPKAEIPVTTVKAPESTVQMYASAPFSPLLRVAYQGLRLIVMLPDQLHRRSPPTQKTSGSRIPNLTVTGE